MAYWLDIYRFPNSTEYEYKWAGRYGAKGERRGKRAKATPEQIKKQNQQNRERYVRRLIKANFFPDDLWVTLKYPAGERKPLAEVKKDLKNFWIPSGGNTGEGGGSSSLSCAWKSEKEGASIST